MNKHEECKANCWKYDSAVILLVVLEAMVIILFSQTTAYAEEDELFGEGAVDHYYPMYQDIHVMIFIGFGFLMSFLTKYSHSAIGFTLMVAAFTLQWSVLTNGFWERVNYGEWDHKIHLGIKTLITSDFCSAAILISFGGVIGKISPTQLVIMAFLECIFYGLNEMIGAKQLHAVDMGGSIFIHIFGAYFGLAVSYAMTHVKSTKLNPFPSGLPTTSNYQSDIFAMFATVFLWLYWPSFNGALALEQQQHRVVINTVISLTGSCVAGFLASKIFRHHHKFDMIDIQNATLAGGVAVGSSADLVIKPWGALLVGMVAGFISTVGFAKLQAYLFTKIGLHDTCGIHNLHGMPGILGGLAGTISALTAKENEYGIPIDAVFPKRDKWSGGMQAGHQCAATFIAVGLGVGFGLLTGWFLTVVGCEMDIDKMYKDETNWEVAEDFHETHHHHHDEEDAVGVDKVKLDVAGSHGGQVTPVVQEQKAVYHGNWQLVEHEPSSPL